MFVALSAIWIRGLRGIELRGTKLRVMNCAGYMPARKRSARERGPTKKPVIRLYD